MSGRVEYVGWRLNMSVGLYNTGLTDERVVRCADCKWSEHVQGTDLPLMCTYRSLSRFLTGERDFCSRGEEA